MTTKLPVVLESLRIASPCTADWDAMVGDDQVRFCGRCEKNVYNLSTMTREAAETLVAEREGRLCIRLYRRADGTLLTADCPVGARRLRLRERMWARISGAAASVALLFGLWSSRARADLALGGDQKKPVPTVIATQGGPVSVPPHLMGKIAMKPPEPPRPFQGEVAMPQMGAPPVVRKTK
jgi:hypothetical protein